ncbi:hypothetical protein L6452_37684 [Arctium lappa]|uniref:Uncharacterized protein n=1 Tax=Arctium lappa TaxID=4217 RepID=A0ACB8Y4S0_ARCLA|nr:hypothetical protein L6452_37684 [Arctium lappa]
MRRRRDVFRSGEGPKPPPIILIWLRRFDSNPDSSNTALIRIQVAHRDDNGSRYLLVYMILDTKKVDPCNGVKVKKDKGQDAIQSSVVNEFGEKSKRWRSDDRSRFMLPGFVLFSFRRFVLPGLINDGPRASIASIASVAGSIKSNDTR